MTLLAPITQDHELIVGVLDALAVFTRSMSESGHLDRDGLREFAAFFTGFADIHHASKEEQVLFPTLERSGARWDQGPLAEARREHRQERYFMRSLTQLATQHTPPDPEELRRLVRELDAFERTMRDHVRKEDEHVLPLVALLDDTRRADLEQRLLEFDRTPPSAQDLPGLHQLAARLTTRYRAQ